MKETVVMETDQIADRKRHHQERDVRSSKGQEQHWGRCQPLGETAMDGRRGWAQSALVVASLHDTLPCE